MLNGFLLLRLQVRQVGPAEWAGDRFEVKTQVIHQIVVECFEKIGAELFAWRAAKTFAPPNGADRVLTAIALLHHDTQLLTQRFRGTQSLLDLGGLLLRQS